MDRHKLRISTAFIASVLILIFISTGSFSQQAIMSGTSVPIQQGGVAQGAATIFNCSTNLTCTLAGGIVTITATGGTANAVTAASAATAANQVCVASGASRTCTYIDFPDVKVFPVASCAGSTATALVNYQTTQSPACDSNNNGIFVTALPTAGTSAFMVSYMIPGDWDTTNQPFIKVSYSSRSNSSGTVIWTAASACTSSDGSVTANPSFHTESAFASQTMASTNVEWAQSGQFTAMTSGNNCVPGGLAFLKVTLTGTASASGIGVTSLAVTTPRRLVVQAD